MTSLDIIVGVACLVSVVSGCAFEIESCQNHEAGFVIDPCNNKCFYTCEEKLSGDYTAKKRCCNKCQTWSQDLLTCVRVDNDNDCVFNPTIVYEECTLVVGPNPYTFYSGLELMSCAVGTEFDQDTCGCVKSETNPLNDGSQITCINFEDGVKGTGGVYVKPENVVLEENCFATGNTCGYFKNATILIELFANCLDSNLQFSMAAFVSRDSGSSDKMYILGNGDCGEKSSFDVVSQQNTFESVVRNTFDQVASSGAVTATDGQLYHIAVVYDGNMVTTYKDGQMVTIEPIFGRLKRVTNPMIIGNNLCEGEDSFTGYMDTISFARVAFSPAQVLNLSNNQNQCLPTV